MMLVAIIGSAGLVLTTFLVAMTILTRAARTIRDPLDRDGDGEREYEDLQRTIDESRG